MAKNQKIEQKEPLEKKRWKAADKLRKNMDAADLLVDMLEPYEGRVFDPCYGSGGMFVQSEKFIQHRQYRHTGGNVLPPSYMGKHVHWPLRASETRPFKHMTYRAWKDLPGSWGVGGILLVDFQHLFTLLQIV